MATSDRGVTPSRFVFEIYLLIFVFLRGGVRGGVPTDLAARWERKGMEQASQTEDTHEGQNPEPPKDKEE